MAGVDSLPSLLSSIKHQVVIIFFLLLLWSLITLILVIFGKHYRKYYTREDRLRVFDRGKSSFQSLEAFFIKSVKRAIASIKVAEVKDVEIEPLVVVGMSIKFPQDATSAESFWQLLMERRSAVTEFPKSRLNADAFYDDNRHNTHHSVSSLFLYFIFRILACP